MPKEENGILERLDLHRAILDQLHEGVYLVDRNRSILYWNAGAERISGYSSAEVVGSSCADDVLVHVDDTGRSLCRDGCPLHATMEDGEPREAEVYLHHKEGHRVPVHIRSAPLRDSNGDVSGGIEVFSENFTRAALREEIATLQKLALQDELLNIANRRCTEMALQSRHGEMNRYAWSFGVLMIDIDHFKQFNDTYGHDIGDRVLQMVAATLASNVRLFDIVGRWGGEEFLVVMAKVQFDELRKRGEMLRNLVKTSGLTIEDAHLSVTISAGGTIARPGEAIPETLKRADDLLYRSKSSGRNRCSFEE